MTTDADMWRHASDTLAKILNILNNTFDMSWRDIALCVRPVPFGTLASIAAGNPIPRKWRHKFRHLAQRERPDLFSYPVNDLARMLAMREEVLSKLPE